MSTWITLGRNGDVMAVLPLLYREFQETGVKPNLVISTAYQNILDGCSYVESIPFEGEFTDLHNAHKLALTLTKNPVIAQVAAPAAVMDRLVAKGKFQTTTTSFETEMFRIAGKADLWPINLPLVFDKRNKAREEALWEQLSSEWHYKRRKQPLILVSTSGYSSPFHYAELLWELLRNRFNVGYNLVDISNIQSERIYDLLGIYEKARCLIAIDSAPLHLAHSVNLPVCALIADKPTLWHGTAWRPNHISYVRYSKFPSCYKNMFDAIENIGKPESSFTK